MGDLSPISKYVECTGWEIHYLEWGSPSLPPVIAWHGLARVGHDFDVLARELSSKFRIIAPDTIGRGLSSWSTNGDADYCFDVYGQIVNDFCNKLGISQLAWIGTSMGGAFGIWLAGSIFRDRISHLVINDIGPEMPQEAMDRIVKYVGSPPEFKTITELERYLRMIYAPFGYIPGDEWRKFTEYSARRVSNGNITTHYDPKIVNQFVVHKNDWLIWDYYDAITSDTLLLRGEYSDLLSREMAEAMTTRGPKCELVECKGCGHAPALNVPVQIDCILEFLTK